MKMLFALLILLGVTPLCVAGTKLDDIEFYLKRPRTLGDFHGQAPVLWLINELLERNNNP